MSKTVQDLKKEHGEGDAGKAVVDPKSMNPKQKFKHFLTIYRPNIAAALPRHMSVDRMVNVIYVAALDNPKLLECEMSSLIRAAMHCAQLGLEPNTPMQHAFLVPFKEKKTGKVLCQVLIGYRGMIDLARRSKQIVSISAHEVRENDEFRYAYGLNEELYHVPADGERGEVKYYYAVARLVGGGHAFEVMTQQQVKEIMLKTQSGGRYGPWLDHPVEMGRKTPIRRLWKYIPTSIEMGNAMALDDMASDNREQILPSDLDESMEIKIDDDLEAEEGEE